MQAAADAKRQSEAAAALEAERKKREALSAKIAAAQAVPEPVAPVRASSPQSSGSGDIEQVIEDEDEFVPEELDELEGSGDSVF